MKKSIIIVLPIIILAGFFSYWELYYPKNVITDTENWDQRSEEELRNCSHKILYYSWHDPYIALLALESIGDASSIPYVLNCLKSSERKDSMIGTNQERCVKILMKITKKPNLGYRYSDWKFLEKN